MCAKLVFLLFFTTGCFSVLLSQSTCNGKLLDPVVRVTFGAGPNPGQPLRAGVTSYQYSAKDCPADGYYSVLNKTEGCFYGDWHVVTDHTGDANGYFMLTNGSYGRGDFYVDTVKNLCSNTTYEFGAWLLEVDTPSACATVGLGLPNVTFRVEKTDGTVLQTYNTGDIPATTLPEWKRYSFFFTTSEPAIVLRIANNSPGGCGNDLAMDDITFSACSPVVSTSVASSNTPGSAYFCYGVDTSIRFGSNIRGNYNKLQYQWQASSNGGQTWVDIAGATDSALTQHYPPALAPGMYLNRLETGEYPNNINIPECRIISDTSVVTIQPLPVPSASSNTPVCEGDNLILMASGGNTYNWSGPGSYTATGAPVTIPVVTKANQGRYLVSVMSQYGCKATDTLDAIVNTTPNAVVSANVSVCEGVPTQLTGSGGSAYSWSPSAGLTSDTIPNPMASPAGTTNYVLTVANQFGCTDTASVMVHVIKKPVANAGPARQMTQGQSITLAGAVAGDSISYYWTPDAFINSTKLLQPTINPMESMTYSLHVISNEGCAAATSNVSILVYKKIEVPNAFSPNGDGINDTWNIVALQTYATAELSIFARSGQMVYHSTGYNKQWDGKYNGSPLPIGTYYYIIDLKNATPVKSGSITIIR